MTTLAQPNMKQDLQLDMLDIRLVEHFGITRLEGMVPKDYQRPHNCQTLEVMVSQCKTQLTVQRCVMQGSTDMYRSIHVEFTDDWSAEKWLEFEQKCKDNL
jgi:hypothetical protein